MIQSALRLLALSTIAFVPSQAWAGVALGLMPMPRSVAFGEGHLPIDGPFITELRGCAGGPVSQALARFDRDVRVLSGTEQSGMRQNLTIKCLEHDPNLLSIDAKEAYRLSVTKTGIAVDADGETGVLRALATLRQLVTRSGSLPTLPYVEIDDAPRFVWRGLMVDVARHFMTVATLKRQIDAMELAKLNLLHLHLSDNEAFRVESHKFPKLTGVARDPRFYTKAEIRDLVRYAAERGVRVVPEFDMPGHNLALVTAYPEMATAPITADDPLRIAKGALNPASEKTYVFLKTLLGEMAPLFPDRQFHIGGDEVSDAAWKGSAEVEVMKVRLGFKTKQEVEAWFHARVRKILAGLGKTSVGWDEMLDAPQDKSLIIQSWRSSNPVSTATAKGHRVIVSAGYYLDHLQPADVIYQVDPLDPVAYTTMTALVLEQVRRNPVTAALVSDGLVAKPLPPLTAKQEKLVLGGEGPLWSEIVSDEMLDGRLWPRGLALAERLWSPATLRDNDDMYARLLLATDRLRTLGILDEPLRDRMVARLAPEAPQVVRQLVDIVAPTRMYSHMHVMAAGSNQKPQDLIEPADAASTDGSVARRFRVNVTRYLAGSRAEGNVLRADLTAWRENAAPFARVASGRPLLEAAVPVAQDIGAVGRLGLAALDAIEQGVPLTAAQITEGRALLKKLADYENASKSLMTVSVMKQPPAHLIVLVAPDVARLVDAAEAAPRK